MNSIKQAERYTAVAIALHWAIAAAIIGNFALGWWMHEAIEVAETQARAITAFQLHKSLGLTVLALSLLRLAWRWMNPPPALPAGMAAWERSVAQATHVIFYGLMIGVPLTGWLLVSAQWSDGKPLNVPTLWFGQFEVPHLLGLSELTNEARARWAEGAGEAHEWLAFATAGLLALHVGAALKHHFIVRDDVLMRMAPKAGLGVAVMVLALIAWLFLKPAASAVEKDEITSSAGSNWIVDATTSAVHFSGTHAGVPFRGRFSRWQADIRFDPADLMHSQIGGTFETASASDGVVLHDESLPQKEWFDVERHPAASFRSTRITSDTVDGVLTIKGHALPVTLALSVAGDSMTLNGRFEVDRAAADLGMESDPEGQYVSRKITVEVRIEATRNVLFRTQ
ncbi:MAG: cytochrome b/b6 domain-containing protein [Pseudomonadota bacterium]